MTTTMYSELDRLEELLADRAIFGLTTEEETELGQLLANHPETDADQFERAAASIDLAFQAATIEEIPESVAMKIRRQANQWLEEVPTAKLEN